MRGRGISKENDLTLSAFLAAKPLYYDKIDLERMPSAYRSIEKVLKVPKIIHVVGTNGKGTTGRFLASALWRSGLDIGHYTSPHILRFNERIWSNGTDASDEQLEVAHEKLLALFDEATAASLSYFEYTTFLAIVLFSSCDWVVLEAGLGGEYDATNAFAKELSIFTPIAMDHEAFLGNTIESVAKTKLRSMGPKALTGIQPHSEVYTLFDEIAVERGSETFLVHDLLADVDIREVERVSQRLGLPEYLRENLSMAAAAMKVIGVEVEYDDFLDAPLFGRLSALDAYVTIDVGHNTLAADAIVRAMAGKKVVLVYNSYKDKAYREILHILKPIVRHVEIIAIEDERIESAGHLIEAITANGLTYSDFSGVREEVDYLVFGSFSVVEQFLKEYYGK